MSRPEIRSFLQRPNVGGRGNANYRLTEEDAAVVKGMLLRGDKQHDIACYFGVNAGRIADIATRTKFSWVPITSRNLPPPGPYNVRQLMDENQRLRGNNA
jgi:hypothetical protein